MRKGVIVNASVIYQNKVFCFDGFFQRELKKREIKERNQREKNIVQKILII